MKLPTARLSFRWQIIFLGGLAALLFLSVLLAAFAALGYTKSAVLEGEKGRLWEVTGSLARAYADKADFARQNNQTPALEVPTAEYSVALLRHVTRFILQNTDGVEGGFYSASNNLLVGDSLSEHSETGEEPDSAVKVADGSRAAISEVAREAVLRRRSSEKVITDAQAIVLIQAIPIRDGQHYVGSAWTMKRLPALPGSNRFRAYLTLAGLGIAALACVILTILVVQKLQSGVNKIEGGLENLEHDLTWQIPLADDPDEIRRIAEAINRLGSTLKENIEHERQIESKLRHSERLAALGGLVAGVAHEVRNPLATIRLRVQMCQREIDNPRVRESCVVALEEIQRLDRMVNRLLSFGQPIQLHAEPTNVDRLVQQRLENFGDRAREKGVKFVTQFNDEIGPLQLDRGRMAQVFDNVIQNAIEAIPESGGTVWVNVESLRLNNMGMACVQFRDSGEGICQKDINRIFDPFFTTKASGTGIGLSICRELVLAHGGEIQIESGDARGTTIRILLPLRNESRSHSA
jgi:signal transduction histidine kinase